MQKPNGSGLELAIKAAGSKAALADLLGIRPQSVSKWKKIPISRMLEIEKCTGVSRRMLCPELFEEVTL